MSSMPGPGWSEEARGGVDAQRAVTFGGAAEQGEGLLEFMERTGRIKLAGQGATWGSGEQQCRGWGLDEETTKRLNAQSVGVSDLAADAQLGGSETGLSEEAASRRKAPVGSSGAEQAGGQ